MFKFLKHHIHIIFSLVCLLGVCSPCETQDYSRDLRPNFNLLIKLISLNKQVNFVNLDTFRIGIPQDENIHNLIYSCIDSVLIAFFEYLNDKNVHSKPFKIYIIPSDSLVRQSNNFLQGILINNKSETNLKNLLEYCKRENVLSFTFDSACVVKGVAVGVYTDNNNEPKTLINWEQLKAEGWDFDAQILQFAKIFR